MVDSSNDFLPMLYSYSSMSPSHFLYADDTLLFCNGTTSNIRRIVVALKFAWRTFWKISELG